MPAFGNVNRSVASLAPWSTRQYRAREGGISSGTLAVLSWESAALPEVAGVSRPLRPVMAAVDMASERQLCL